jgi:large subunit GTPase 1
MRSVTEQGALDEFLSTAELAGTDFTAEKTNSVTIIHADQKNPYLLSAAEERSTIKKHKANRKRLTVPRRPAWNDKTTRAELDRSEKESLLEWRRGLAELQEVNDLLMTPFERNLEVWRQLWRVIERSDLVVQIVDARNPLLFRSDDLESYVKEVDSRKNNLLLVNKADMMTLKQRETWADYFEQEGIHYTFFSASLAKEMIEARELIEGSSDEEMDVEEADTSKQGPAEATAKRNVQAAREDLGNASSEDSDDETGRGLELPGNRRTRILTVDELEDLFLEHAPELDCKSCKLDMFGKLLTIR